MFSSKQALTFYANSFSGNAKACFMREKIRAQLFKTNDVVSQRIVKTLIIKYGIYPNIFAEKM